MKNTVKLTSMIAAIYLFAGYQELSAQQKDSLKEKQIEEVVMIGYGKAKKIDLTSAIAKVKPEELTKTPSALVGQGLQGQVAGVQVTSLGSPGDTPKINIRGVHSLFGDNQPLYVVDGVFVDDIDFLSPHDVLDMSILKDASSSAIYGRKGANGVVIITTKGGGFNKKSKISYNTFYGVQQAANVVKMANTEQFVNFALESGSNTEIASVAAAIQRYGRSRINPNLPDVNTDWYNETMRIAPMQNHNISVDGGTEKISYSLGGDFFTQDGILKMKNSFERFNIRGKVDAKANDWLTVGTSVVFTKSEKYEDEASAWSQIYFAVPIFPVYDYTYTNAYPNPYGDAKNIGFRDHQNPFALLDNADNLTNRTRVVLNAYAEVSLIPKELTFRSSFSYNNRQDNGRYVALPFYTSDSFQRTIAESSITRANANFEKFIWDNTLTYNKVINKHDITVMVGSAYDDDYYTSYSVKGFFDPAGTFSRDREQTWYIQNTVATNRVSEDYGEKNYNLAYLGRVSYKYDNKYILYATLRNEGSNKYQEKRKFVPAVGFSWVASEENFLQGIDNLNLLKFRAGWGRLVNNQAPANRYPTASSVSTVFNDQSYIGSIFSTYSDKVNWEYTDETNVGLTAELFRRKLTLEADYFIKKTNDMEINSNPIIAESSRVSVAAMKNEGFELSAAWKGKFSENFGYNISGNFSKIKNEITDLGGVTSIDTGMAEFRQLYAVGQPVKVFYGWDIVGVYQNQAEVNADPTAVYANNLGAGTVKPGYFKYRDVNNDGVLDAKDRVYLGSPIPKYYFGGSIKFNYKNWDLSTAFYGQGGNVVLNRNRAEVFRTAGRNVDAELAINRWHGEGTSNEFPSSEGYRNGWNQRNSKFWLEKGDFFRVQNVQLGYNFRSKSLPEMRFTVTVDRPYLWSKSKLLFNPEVPNDGVDIDIYPTPSVLTFGYAVKF